MSLIVLTIENVFYYNFCYLPDETFFEKKEGARNTRNIRKREKVYNLKFQDARYISEHVIPRYKCTYI